MTPRRRSSKDGLATPHPRPSGRAVGLWLAVVALLVLALPSFGGCDTGAVIYPRAPRFLGLRVVSAYDGVKLPNGQYATQCGSDFPGLEDPVLAGEPEQALLLNLIFESEQRLPPPVPDAPPQDFDVSIHSGEVLSGPNASGFSLDARLVDGGDPEDVGLSTVTNYSVSLSCVERVPSSSADPVDDLNACSGYGTEASFAVQSVFDRKFQERDRHGHDIILLIDLSGSISGRVDKDDFREGTEEEIELSPQFGQLTFHGALYSHG